MTVQIGDIYKYTGYNHRGFAQTVCGDIGVNMR